MNKTQRIISLVGAFVISLLLLFPPYQLKLPGNPVFNAGYYSIASPPMFKNVPRHPATVNIELHLTQIFGVFIITGLLIISFKGKEK